LAEVFQVACGGRGYLKNYVLLLDSSEAQQQSAAITPFRYHASRSDLQVCGSATAGRGNIVAGGIIQPFDVSVAFAAAA